MFIARRNFINSAWAKLGERPEERWRMAASAVLACPIVLAIAAFGDRGQLALAAAVGAMSLAVLWGLQRATVALGLRVQTKG